MPRVNSRRPAALHLSAQDHLSAAGLFTHAMCGVCLVLQRFGAQIGQSQLFVSLVLAPALIGLLLLTGQARVRATPPLLFFALLCSFLVTTSLAVLYPDFSFRFSILSIAELGILYATLIVEPSERFRSAVVLPIFVFWCRIIAIAGLLQYGLQFAHVRLFSFASLVPALNPLLAEQNYHVVAPIAYGSSILRSNGFFLLEPSILSQVMALAIVVDGLVLKRLFWIPVYALGILASFSGTGPLVLVLTLVLVGFVSPSQLGRAVVIMVAGVALVGLAAVAFPDQFATLTARASGNDASSHARYAQQLVILDTSLSDQRLVLGFGPGAADGYVQSGSMSAALKLLFDYGALGLFLFAVFLVGVLWRWDAPALSIASLLLFQLGGGYLLFPPLVFVIALLCIWSRPVTPAALAPRRAWARSAPLAVET